MTIIKTDKLTHTEISPPSQWDHTLDKFVDWEPHSNGQLFITHVDPIPPSYPNPTYTAEQAGTTGGMLDDLPIGFGKKYPNKTPNELMKIEPGYIVWCRENTSRVFCSDGLYEKAKLMKAKDDVKFGP